MSKRRGGGQQLDIFADGGGSADLPLFSGVAVSVALPTVQDDGPGYQARLFGCPACQDTGRVKVRRKMRARSGKGWQYVDGVNYCLCPAGQRAREA